jgi:hypothetical protein
MQVGERNDAGSIARQNRFRKDGERERRKGAMKHSWKHCQV